jgi:hypothetical protein
MGINVNKKNMSVFVEFFMESGGSQCVQADTSRSSVPIRQQTISNSRVVPSAPFTLI